MDLRILALREAFFDRPDSQQILWQHQVRNAAPFK